MKLLILFLLIIGTSCARPISQPQTQDEIKRNVKEVVNKSVKRQDKKRKVSKGLFIITYFTLSAVLP